MLLPHNLMGVETSLQYDLAIIIPKSYYKALLLVVNSVLALVIRSLNMTNSQK